MIYAIVGASGAGKTTLLRNIMQVRQDARPLLSFTTRDKRPTDLDGEYNYVSEETFDDMKASGEFLWTAEARGKHYGTRKADVEQALAGGLYFPILVPDVLKKLYEFAFLKGKQKALHFIYMRVEDEEELARRLAGRGDAPESIQKSLGESRLWNKEARTLGIRFTVIDSTQPQETVLQRALTVIDGKKDAAAIT